MMEGKRSQMQSENIRRRYRHRLTEITESELEEIPLIDTHVHRVHPDRSPEWGNLGGGYVAGPDQERHSRQTILYHMIMEELRREFGMSAEAPLEEVEAERHRRYKKDPKGYFRELICGQNVAMYCLEVGSPLGGAPYTEEEIEYFNASIPEERQCSIVRIERAIETVLKEKRPFDQMMQEYRDYFSGQIEREKAIAIKSCAAYAGGLNVQDVDKSEARKAYEAICQGKSTGLQEKILNNYVLLESTDIAATYDLPIQIHTGSGGGGYIDFRTMDPVNLVDFLKHKKVMNRVRVVLLHGGHPYEENVSYLTAQFANVYTDFSGMFYLCSVKGVERMAALLEKAPLDKVMYGSDGVMFPEICWFSHKHFRRQLPKLLNALIGEGYMTEKRARQAARMFSYENALGCYEKINLRR